MLVYNNWKQNSKLTGKKDKLMDEFFTELFHGDGDTFWSNYEALPVKQSAFVPYANRPRIEFEPGNGHNFRNANKKMIEFWRRIRSAKTESRLPDRESCQRHMINERKRREREKQNYLILHSMLPPGTKNDKNSIIETATKRIQELQCCKQELERNNYELEAKFGKNVNGGTKIRVSVANPTSGIDSILEVLKCLKKLDSRTRSIQLQFSDQNLTAILDIETQMGAMEVEEAVQRTLQQVEQKLLLGYQED